MEKPILSYEGSRPLKNPNHEKVLRFWIATGDKKFALQASGYKAKAWLQQFQSIISRDDVQARREYLTTQEVDITTFESQLLILLHIQTKAIEAGAYNAAVRATAEIGKWMKFDKGRDYLRRMKEQQRRAEKLSPYSIDELIELLSNDPENEKRKI